MIVFKKPKKIKLLTISGFGLSTFVKEFKKLFYDAEYEKQFHEFGVYNVPKVAKTLVYRVFKTIHFNTGVYFIYFVSFFSVRSLRYYTTTEDTKPVSISDYIVYFMRAHPLHNEIVLNLTEFNHVNLQKKAKIELFSTKQLLYTIDRVNLFLSTGYSDLHFYYKNITLFRFSNHYYYEYLHIFKKSENKGFLFFLKEVAKEKKQQDSSKSKKLNIYTFLDYYNISASTYQYGLGEKNNKFSYIYPLTPEIVSKNLSKSTILPKSQLSFKNVVLSFLVSTKNKAKLLFRFKLLHSFYTFLRPTLLALFIALLFIITSFILFKAAFLRIIGGWLVVGLFVFWLLSGFNHFLKRYRYGKHTSANQRFWKRAFMCFWAIEGFLFLIFLYYALNASGEPYFMYDQSGLYNNQLQIIDDFVKSTSVVVFAIFLLIHILTSIKFSSFRQTVVSIFIVTGILVYILLSESYQFYYLVNFYDETFWVFSEEEQIWELEYEIPRMRTKNHYLTLIILAKFWHYIFIFSSWVFFVMKCLELGKVKYAITSMNLQNIIIFYIMNWVCLYTWFKWFLRRFLDQQYYWFFSSYRPTIINSVVNDILLLLTNMFNYSQPYSYFFTWQTDIYSSGQALNTALSYFL